MELGVFVVALVLIAGVGLLAFGRMPFPTRRSAPNPDVPNDTKTAEPPGRVDDSG